MKFGRHLLRTQLPEWSAFYINYKGLKKLIKAAVATVKAGTDPDLAEFFFTLDRNLEDVDEFYNKKFADATRRLTLLQERYGSSKGALETLDLNDIEELRGALLELRDQLRKVQWFGDLNRRGFIKITKKLDKKIPNVCTKERYLASKVDLKPFATNMGVEELKTTINGLLSTLGDIQATDDANDAQSVHSAHSIKQVSSRSILNLPQGLLDTADQAIRNDDVPTLEEFLAEVDLGPSEPAMQRLLINLLQRCISCQSKQSISYLLKHIESLDETDDINKRNCLHRLVIYIGRAKSAKAGEHTGAALLSVEQGENRYLTPAASPPLGPARSDLEECSLLSRDDEYVKLLAYVLQTLEPRQRTALKSKDTYGRFPLHYAAQFGFVVICELVMKYMQDWGQFNVEHGIDAPEWQDNDGQAPLHLSVIGGHPLTTQALLKGENWQGQNDQKAAMRRDISKSSAVLAIATKANFTRIVKLLVDAGVDINWQDPAGETSLHVAARFGHEKCAEILIQGSPEQKANIDLTEKTFAWTPLHIASVDGHLSIVELLVAAGADINKPDVSGWLAREHAALRGHLAIARKLKEASSTISSPRSTASTENRPTSPSKLSSIGTARSQMTKVETTEPVKTFGHRYLTNESMVLVSLGSMDMRKNVPAVKLDKIPLAEAHSTQLDTALSVIVSVKGAQGEPTTIDLPVPDNISTEPMVFTAIDATKVKVYFDIVPTYSGHQDHKVGRGVAILGSIKQAIGVSRMNLQGDVSVPIMSTDLEVIGTVNFNFLVITPFSHPNMSITTKHTYWKEVSSTMIIGHRGLGKNVASNRSLQLGENTLQSFIAATNLGASYVEFDVQLTKDHVPVIYHDFLVSETGIDAPVHTLTADQFLHVNDASARVSRPPTPPRDAPQMQIVRGTERVRSLSMGHLLPDIDMAEKMKHTRDFKEKGYKANSRGNFIQAPFTTLEEMFVKLEEHVGFNIEMKYPMLHESEEHDMDAYAVELNSFCDTVLNKVYDLCKKRKIIFSSFNPDICLLLSFKQPSIPVLFLTDAGTSPVGDIRASSLQEAIRFASRWNLLGVVSAAEPLCNSPRLVKVVKDSGLVCVSYGTLNNDEDKVDQQVREGIDAVIVDNVLKIYKGMSKNAARLTDPTTVESANLINGVGGVKEPMAGTTSAPTAETTMESIKAVFFKPDPQAQVRKCNQLIRQNTRKLDRDIANMKLAENKAKSLIIQANRRAQRNPAQAKQAEKDIRIFARELIRTRKQHNRLVTSKAQLNSVSMQVSEAFAVRKIEGSIRSSVGIMKDVNSLVKLPELMGTMRELSQELVKAGIIEEMVGDSLPDELEEEDEEAETEVDKVLGEILADKMSKVDATPTMPEPVKQPVQEEEEDEDAEAMLDQMRGRLEALKS
ncbi:glycerophosphoryl diester phosphodiesterase [Diplocarpon rosae]|nr:glycerophosphoryl diester phosphodiesterase [Diplocarpon rosae]